MLSSDIIQDLQPIFSDVLDLPDLRLTAESNASDVEGWDSLAHISLVVAIEKRYNIKFALAELRNLKNVGEMADLIVKKTSYLAP
ncbi:MAG: acyl carrier protein [Bryobacteraceae bacterium]|jgi:acyl carrier protein